MLLCKIYIYILNMNMVVFSLTYIIVIAGLVIKYLVKNDCHTLWTVKYNVLYSNRSKYQLVKSSNLYLKLDCITSDALARPRYSITTCNRSHYLYYVLFKSAITSIYYYKATMSNTSVCKLAIVIKKNSLNNM